MSPTILSLVNSKSISSHSWNADRTKLAICPSSEKVYIFSKSGSSWTMTHTLSEHSHRVLSIDWAPKSNLIVTCGEDRDAYVWKLEKDNTWKPRLVVLRINRAALCVKWARTEEKFAVGSGSKTLAVCYFQEEHNWWVAKNVKYNFGSSITCLSWHPTATILAVGSSDYHTRVFSVAIKGVDKRPEGNSWGDSSKIQTFGTLLYEWKNENDAWIHDVAFSSSGMKLVWVAHDSSISVFDSNNPSSGVCTLYESFLPSKACLFQNEENIIAGGHECIPFLYQHSAGKLKFIKKLDSDKKSTSSDVVSSAMDRFKQMDLKSQTSTDVSLSSVHQNSINAISAYRLSGNNVTEFATSSLDGNLVLWSIC